MAEALVAARNGLPDDGLSDAQWRWARGHVLDVKPDGFPWGVLEDPRNFATAAERRFALFLFPGATVARVQKYLGQDVSFDLVTGRPAVVRQRLWQIQWTTLPLAARNILIATGVLTIGPSGDFTWAQVKAFVLNLNTGLSDTEDL